MAGVQIERYVASSGKIIGWSGTGEIGVITQTTPKEPAKREITISEAAAERTRSLLGSIISRTVEVGREESAAREAERQRLEQLPPRQPSRIDRVMEFVSGVPDHLDNYRRSFGRGLVGRLARISTPPRQNSPQ